MTGLETKLQIGTFFIKKGGELGIDPKDLATLILELYCENDYITSKEIKSAVCEYFDLSNEGLMSQSRDRDLVYARFAYCLLCRTYTNHNLTQIARSVGRKDHTTICHAIKTAKDMIEFDQVFKRQISDLTKIMLKQDEAK